MVFRMYFRCKAASETHRNGDIFAEFPPATRWADNLNRHAGMGILGTPPTSMPLRNRGEFRAK